MDPANQQSSDENENDNENSDSGENNDDNFQSINNRVYSKVFFIKVRPISVSFLNIITMLTLELICAISYLWFAKLSIVIANRRIKLPQDEIKDFFKF
jgi:hypothetical protein